MIQKCIFKKNKISKIAKSRLRMKEINRVTSWKTCICDNGNIASCAFRVKLLIVAQKHTNWLVTKAPNEVKGEGSRHNHAATFLKIPLHKIAITTITTTAAAESSNEFMLDRGISFFFVNMINSIAVIATHKIIFRERNTL